MDKSKHEPSIGGPPWCPRFCRSACSPHAMDQQDANLLPWHTAMQRDGVSPQALHPMPSSHLPPHQVYSTRGHYTQWGAGPKLATSSIPLGSFPASWPTVQSSVPWLWVSAGLYLDCFSFYLTRAPIPCSGHPAETQEGLSRIPWMLSPCTN